MKGLYRFDAMWITVALVIGICSALISCGSGGSDGPVADIDDDIRSDQPIQSVVPTLLGARAELAFRLPEDSSLRGRFYQPEGVSDAQVVLRSLPEHGRLTLQSDSTVFLYEPVPDYWGADEFSYLADNAVEVTVRLVVTPVNDAPVLSQEIARVAEQGRLFVTTISATDKDGDELVFSARGLPEWLSLDSGSGVLSGLPTQSDVGITGNVSISVVDPAGASDELIDVRFEVLDVNDAPTLNLSQLPRTLKARESITVQVFPDDADGDSVSLVVEENSVVIGSASGGAITLTASDVNDVTEVNIVIRATDLLGRITRKIVPLTVYPLTDSGKGLTLSGSKEGRGIPLVIMGDGYTIDQQDLFREHVDNVIDNLRSDAGIARHLAAFNIHMISTVSLDSGADDNEQTDSRNTAFDSVYNCRSIARLICANTLALLQSALSEYGDTDQIILLVNDRRYGGSGNSGSRTAITSAYSPQIALHELGHSVANLADEYVDNLITETSGLPPFVEGEYANITAITDPERVPWSHWIDPRERLPTRVGEPGVGMFEGGLFRPAGLFRPTHDSRMRSYDAPFGPVNSEQWVLRLYTITQGIRGLSPSGQSVEIAAGEPADFIVSPLFGEDIQAVSWAVDGVLTDAGTNPNALTIPQLARGRHSVTVTVTDISGAIRKPPPHAGVFSWSWEVSVR